MEKLQELYDRLITNQQTIADEILLQRIISLQISKKPILQEHKKIVGTADEFYIYSNYYCPTCNSVLFYNEWNESLKKIKELNEITNRKLPNFCQHCSQAIDWNE